MHPCYSLLVSHVLSHNFLCEVKCSWKVLYQYEACMHYYKSNYIASYHFSFGSQWHDYRPDLQALSFHVSQMLLEQNVEIKMWISFIFQCCCFQSLDIQGTKG